MQIGLLQCDHVNEQFQPLIGDYPDAFRELFAKHAPSIELRVYDVCHGELPASPDECAGYITTGSKYSVYDDVEWIHKLADFVRAVYAHQQKYVGICFGHQMLAHALGGRVAKSDHGWGIGVKPVEIQQQKSWMTPKLASYQLLLSHQDQVLELPQGAEILGGNEHCPISILSLDKHMLGFQAHPEFNTNYAEALMNARLERIGSATVNAAKESLKLKTDEDVIAKWIAEFLAG